MKGFHGLLYSSNKDSTNRIKIGTRYQLEKGEVYKYTYYSQHIMSVDNPLYRDKIKSLINNNIKNETGAYTIKTLDHFKKLFPNFLKTQAYNDKLKLKLDRHNGKKEFLTLDVKY